MSATAHSRMREAFAPARRLEPTDADVAQVLARVRAPARQRRLRSRAAVLVALACLVAVAVAGAASRVLPIGTELPSLESVLGDGEPQYTSNRVVVGTGALPRAGRWQVTVLDSDQGQCLTFERPDSRFGDMSSVCGMGSFDAISHGGGDELPDTTVVFGPAPERAATVRVTAANGFQSTAPVHKGTSDMEGDFYVLEIPRRGVRNAEITWLDDRGQPPGPGMFIPSTLDYGPAPKPSGGPH
jgi:hypothetical protein